MGIPLIIDHSSSYEEMIKLLSMAKGVDLETFDAKGARSLMNLYMEIQQRDVLLTLNEKGQADKFSQKVEIIITDLTRNARWLETQRRYPNGTIVSKLQEFTIRETRKRGESGLKAAQRGLLEELHYVPYSHSELQLLHEPESKNTSKSSVYPGILSTVTTTRFEMHTERFPCRQGEQVIILKDYGGKRNPLNDNWVETEIRAFSLAA